MLKAAITFQRHKFSLNAELQLEKGTITALIGASGSGKSSLFRLLSGLELPLTGQIYADDVCWFDADKKINLGVQHRKVGMVFQDYALFEHLTVYENIAYGVEEKAQATVVNQWLNRIKLSDKAQVYPQALSGGEKQRVALARALATEPDILLLDEPFSALDTVIRHELRRELQALISDAQIPVLIATHDLVEARFLADVVYVLVDGEIIQHGPMASVFNHPINTQAARALGWQNILNIKSYDKCHILGGWGGLSAGLGAGLGGDLDADLTVESCKAPFVDFPSAVSAVAIPQNAIIQARVALKPSEADSIHNALSVTVTHSVDMGDHYLIEAELIDGSRVVFQQKPEVVLVSGQILTIFIDLSLIVPLNE